jgi:hypothetical protein
MCMCICMYHLIYDNVFFNRDDEAVDGIGYLIIPSRVSIHEVITYQQPRGFEQETTRRLSHKIFMAYLNIVC